MRGAYGRLRALSLSLPPPQEPPAEPGKQKSAERKVSGWKAIQIHTDSNWTIGMSFIEILCDFVTACARLVPIRRPIRRQLECGMKKCALFAASFRFASSYFRSAGNSG